MPRLVRARFDEDYERLRAELQPLARRLIDADPEGFRKAGKLLDADYPRKAARERLLAQRARYNATVDGQPTPPVARPRLPEAAARQGRANVSMMRGCWMPDPEGGDNLRGARLCHAVADFLGTNAKGELLRALGASLPSGKREANARRAILLGLAAVDPDATAYLGGITDLAKAPWVPPARANRPILGRSDVCRWYYESAGHRCLELLAEAIGVLGSASRNDTKESTPTTTGDGVAHVGPVDPVTDALTRHEAKRKADEAALRAQPWFKAAVQHGKDWDAAKRAAAEASTSYRSELDKLIAEHQDEPMDSETERQFDALKSAIEDVEREAYAKHGFTAGARSAEDPSGLPGLTAEVPIGWQRMQIVLERIAAEVRKEGGDLPTVAALVEAAHTIFSSPIEQNLPAGMLGGQASANTAQRLVSVLGGLRRDCRNATLNRSRADQLDELCDWIEGCLRPVYGDQWKDGWAGTVPIGTPRTAHPTPVRRSRPKRDAARPRGRGWTKQQLCDAGKISSSGFDRIANAAKLAHRPEKGEHGFSFTAEDLRQLIRAALRAAGKRTWKRAGDEWQRLIK